MRVQLDHLIVKSRDREAGAQLLSQILDVPWTKGEPFAAVYINPELTLDFSDYPHRHGEELKTAHYCFMVEDSDLDGIESRVKAAGLAIGSAPNAPSDGLINTTNDGRNFYWNCPDGHLWEVLTVSYARPQSV